MRIEKIIFIDSLIVTSVCSAILIVCCVFADAVSMPAQIALGATAQQIHDSQNTTFLKSNLQLLWGIPVLYILCVCLFKYLRHDDWELQEKPVKRVRTTRELIDELR